MFSKLDSPDSPNQVEEKDICEFLREVMVEYYECFSVEIEIPSKTILYTFDQKLLYRALANLFENTIKYSNKHDCVYNITKHE